MTFYPGIVSHPRVHSHRRHRPLLFPSHRGTAPALVCVCKCHRTHLHQHPPQHQLSVYSPVHFFMFVAVQWLRRVYSACVSVPFAFASMAYAAVRAMPKKGYEPHFPVRDTDDRTYWSMGHSELFGEVAPGIINMTVTHDKDWFMDKHWSNKKGRTCWGPATCICCQARFKHSPPLRVRYIRT